MGRQYHWRIEPLFTRPRQVYYFLSRRLWDEIAYYLPGDLAPAPKELIFFLTYKCNLRCTFCGQRNMNGYVENLPGRMLDTEVSFSELSRIIDELSPRMTELTLCGGEILLYGEWKQFLSHASEHGFKVTIITNGLNLAEHAEYLIEHKLHRLTVSLDGPTEIHDSLRGKTGLFDHVISGIEEVIKLKDARRSVLPYIWINCTVMPENAGYLNGFYRMIRSLSFDQICFQHLFHLDKQTVNRHAVIFRDNFGTECYDWPGYVNDLTGFSAGPVISDIRELKAANDSRILIIPDFTEDEIREYYGNPDFRSRVYQWKCKGPWRSAYILPDGTVTPCCFYDAGNILNAGIKKIWNGRPMRVFRNVLRRYSVFPVCRACPVLYRY